MSILQGVGDLADIAHNRVKRKLRLLGVAMAQGALRGVLHHQKRHPFLQGEIKNAHDVRM